MINKTILLTGLITASASAHASEGTKYLFSVKGGYQWVQDESHDHGDSDGGFNSIAVGLQIDDNWSWDVGYQYHSSESANSDTSTDTWLIESALRYDWYLNDDISLYGRLGGGYWDVEKELNSQLLQKSTGISPITEVGISYKVSDNFFLSTGYQYIDNIGAFDDGRYDSSTLLFGLTYKLGTRNQAVTEEKVEPLPIYFNEIEPEPMIMVTHPAQNFDIFYSISSSKLDEKYHTQIEEVAEILKRYKQSRVVIVGHSDATGRVAYNQNLSETRAENIASELVRLGVPADQIESIGVAATKPIADNRSSKGRAMNRRVEVKLREFEYQK